MVLVLAATLVLMRVENWFVRVIGHSDANVLCRVMGMILAAVAAQMVYSAFHGSLGPGQDFWAERKIEFGSADVIF